MTIHVTPLTPNFGGEIVGLDGHRPRRCGGCHQVAGWNRRGSACWSSGRSTSAIMNSSRSADSWAKSSWAVPGSMSILRYATITLDPSKTDGVLAWYRQGNFLWHIDGATDELPQKATLLTAREVDESGGNTEFASTYVGYEAQLYRRPRRLRSLTCRWCTVSPMHSFRLIRTRRTASALRWDRVPDQRDSACVTHRDSRRSLLLGATAAEVVGWPPDEGKALLERLLEWSTRPESPSPPLVPRWPRRRKYRDAAGPSLINLASPDASNDAQGQEMVV